MQPDVRASGDSRTATSQAEQPLTNGHVDSPHLTSEVGFDLETYEKAKPMFTAALARFRGEALNTKAMVVAFLDHMRSVLKWPDDAIRRMQPYLKQFIAEMEDGKIPGFGQKGSNDQPTPPGTATFEYAYVYLMTTRSSPGWIKVGYTERAVEQRRRELSSATGVRQPFQIAHIFGVPSGTGREAELLSHRALTSFKREKEFFQCDCQQAVPLIEAALHPLLALKALDVRAARDALAASWRAGRETDQRLAVLREEHRRALAQWAANCRVERIDFKSHLGATYGYTLDRNRIIAVLAALISLPVINSLLEEPMSDLKLITLGLVWIPLAVLAASLFLPLSLDGLPEFKRQMTEFLANQQAHRSRLESEHAVQKAPLDDQLRAHRSEQRAAEDKLKSFGLSPMSKKAGKRRW